jgi:hypothetical protein
MLGPVSEGLKVMLMNGIIRVVPPSHAPIGDATREANVGGAQSPHGADPRPPTMLPTGERSRSLFGPRNAGYVSHLRIRYALGSFGCRIYVS